MIPLPFQSVLDSGGRLINNKETWQDEEIFKRSVMSHRDSEGLIAVAEECTLIYVVDCPSLHLVDESALLLPRYLGGGNVSHLLNGMEC
jgi:hypothetical protein